MDGDEVDVVDQLWVFNEDMPRFGRADRHLHGGTHPVKVGDHFLYRKIGAVERLVADDDPLDGRRVAVDVLDEVVKFVFVALVAAVDPGAGRDLEPQARGQARDGFHPVQGRVGAHPLGLAF